MSIHPAPSPEPTPAGAFKKRVALSVPDLLDYGQVKASVTEVLMMAAELWAAETGWQPVPNPVSRDS